MPTGGHVNCYCDLPHTIQNRKQTNIGNKKCYYKILQEPSSLCFTITERCMAEDNIPRDLKLIQSKLYISLVYMYHHN